MKSGDSYMRQPEFVMLRRIDARHTHGSVIRAE
jgi:hypothetical protein